MTANKSHAEPLALEVTVLSAQSLKNPSLIYRLRPYVVISSTSSSANAVNGLLRTRVDDGGRATPTWGDNLLVPVGPTFLRPGGEEDAVIHVSVLSRRPFARPALLGCCRISPADVLDGFRPPTASRRLSYALRSPRHGGRGHGVIHMAVRLSGPGLDHVGQPAKALAPPEQGWCRVAIGIPVARGGVSSCAAHDRATSVRGELGY